MNTILRQAVRHCRPSVSLLSSSRQSPLIFNSSTLLSIPLSRRGYASKPKSRGKGSEKEKEKDKKGTKNKDREGDREGRYGKDTSTLVPGSEQVLSGEAAEEFARSESRMGQAVDWFKREVAQLEMQGAGRVTPDILRPVRVQLPGTSESEACALTDVATVGVREGTTLLVTVFAEDTLKHVEKAIYAAKIPHVVPQKLDSRTLKIPMPKPTVDARAELAKSAAKLAEDTRVQLRRAEQTSVKKGKYGKHSIEIEEFHELLQRQLKEVDKILGDMKKSLGVK